MYEAADISTCIDSRSLRNLHTFYQLFLHTFISHLHSPQLLQQLQQLTSSPTYTYATIESLIYGTCFMGHTNTYKSDRWLTRYMHRHTFLLAHTSIHLTLSRG